MFAVLVVTLAFAGASPEAGDPGFGGDTSTSPETPEEDACVIKGDDGAWHSCDDVINAKKKADDDNPVDDDPQVVALRKRMHALEEANGTSETKPVEAPKKTKLEEDYAKAKLDPSLPLLALRIETERAQNALKALEDKGIGGEKQETARAILDETKSILDEIEVIAVHRMDVCSQRKGNKPLIKNYKMTPGGPVYMTTQEALNALPRVDPVGCERINLVDDKLVARVKREHELKHILATKDFGWEGIDDEKALEKELAAIEKALTDDQVPVLAVPGAKDPPGLRMLNRPK